VYGNSKREGEILALEANPNTIILRTSWLYSEFNKNFVKTMLNLFGTKEELGIVADQYGQPTNATDLAEAIMTIISTPKKFSEFITSPTTVKLHGMILLLKLQNYQALLSD
jgi:dTDP-4-dehydrorhamnose reductase